MDHARKCQNGSSNTFGRPLIYLCSLPGKVYVWETPHVFFFFPQLHFPPLPPVRDGLQASVWSRLFNVTRFIRKSWGWRFIAAITSRLNMMVLSIDLSPESHTDCVAPPSRCGSKRPQSEDAGGPLLSCHIKYLESSFIALHSPSLFSHGRPPEDDRTWFLLSGSIRILVYSRSRNQRRFA